MILWLTGLPCSGKTTIGRALTAHLIAAGNKAELLDGDAVRRQFWPELGFSREEREENVRRLGVFAATISRQGIAVVSAISPYRESRDAIRRQSPEFLEVYINAPLSVCEERDVKGMYKKARSGELQAFTGVSDPYEPPLSAEVECRTDLESVEESVARILRALARLFDVCFTGAGDGV